MISLALTFIIDLLALLGIFIIISLSLNIEFGYAGIPNFGKLLAVAGGAFFIGAFPGRVLAYIYGLLGKYDYIDENAKIMYALGNVLGANPLMSMAMLVVSLILAAAVGAILGFIASYPAIRLREDYLAITLLAMAEILRMIGYNYRDLIGGTLGISVPDPFRWIGGELRQVLAASVIIAVAIIIFIYAELLGRSPVGRTLRAMRDDEVVAEAYGKDVVRLRMKTLMIGSAIGAVGGALYAFLSGSVTALGYDRVCYTFWPWVMVVIGGAANNFGTLLGATLFVTLRKLIIFYKSSLQPFLPFDVVWLEYLLLGTALIMVLIYRPEGIIPEKPTHTLGRKKLERIKELIEAGEA